MSTNVIRLSVRYVEDFHLPLHLIAELFDRYEDSEIEVPFVKPLILTFAGVCEAGVLEGEVTGGQSGYDLAVSKIEWSGVSSGSTFEDLCGLLKSGHGKLSVRVVWEDGEVEDITFDNGDQTIVAV